MDHFYVGFNGITNGYQNTRDVITDSLYDIFGEVPIAVDDDLMSGEVNGLAIIIVKVD